MRGDKAKRIDEIIKDSSAYNLPKEDVAVLKYLKEQSDGYTSLYRNIYSVLKENDVNDELKIGKIESILVRHALLFG